ncbi:MAG TPA: hypothetical protein VFV75_06865 [Candidatus Polarisedimenticolaceae bacterium]|nr:hypothetical protein [Candidatus Polarisedimenticolaceae bacterium]
MTGTKRLACIVLPLVLSWGVRSAPPDLKEAVSVTLHTYRTDPTGATGESSSGGVDLRRGEQGSVYLLLGSFDAQGRPEEMLCHGIGSEPPAPEALARAVEVWKATFTLLDATMDGSTLRADWTRTRAGVHADGGVTTFTLKEGESRTLDFLRRPPSDPADFCGETLRIDAKAEVKEDPAFAGARLRYDLWLLEDAPGARPIQHHAGAEGKQGEAVTVHFPSLRWPLPGLTAKEDGLPAQVFAELMAEIRGRLRADGSIDLQFGAARWLGLGGEKRIGGIGDGGEKTLKVLPGEVLDLKLPAPGARGSHAIQVGGAAGALSPGVEVGNGSVRVAFATFFRDHRMTVRLRARPAA